MRPWKAGMLTMLLSMTMSCASVFGQSASEYFEDDLQRALARAAAAGDEAAMAEALDRGAAPNATGRESMTPLFWVIDVHPNPEALQYLLAHGGDPELGVPHPRYPENEKLYVIERAFERPDTRFLEIVLEAGANPDIAVNNFGQSLLFQTSADNYLDQLAMLIDYGADVNYRDGEYDSTPLKRMISSHNFLAAMMLVEAGADPTLENRFGDSPLYYFESVYEGQLDRSHQDEGFWELVEALKSRGYLGDSY